ncbi:MAG: HAD family hydrolase [Planctomycetia bacterium]|nr:HAD family hydrolase [Planctomycetia bacterium]
MLKAVFFDFDGTLGDTLALCVEAFKNAIEPLVGRSFTDHEIIDTFGPSEEGTIQNLVPDHQEEGIEEYLRQYELLHEKYSAPFPGIREILDFLKKKGIILAIITGKGKKSCDISVNYYKMNEVFDWIETGSPLGPCKPKCIRNTLDHFRLLPSEAVYVGDSPSDVRACREVRVPCIAAAWASSADLNALKEQNPDYLCKDIPALRKVLQNLIERTE